MKFDCKHIEISKEEFGCTLTFSDRKEKETDRDLSVEEILDSLGQYLMIQRIH